jgi:epoxyqueuosine reductase
VRATKHTLHVSRITNHVTIAAMSLTQEVKARARGLGFELVGVTTPDPPAHLEVYHNWLAAGRHGEMGYLETERARQRRADPRRILPECRSILVLGSRYPAPHGHKTEEGEAPLSGRIASYAWGEDYHEVFRARLKELVGYIQEKVGAEVPNRWYADTGPILERELAQRAGLGWIGKNTCLINPQAGSYFLLAEILLGIDLELDAAFTPDRCGSCTRCLEACPTQCILPDRTLDARRCISYLTIELRDPIPKGLRPQMEDWVFGCDICQMVCPWNVRFATPEGDPAFAPRPGYPEADLIEEMSLSPEAFNNKFRGSPVKRAKRRGYLRNVAVALGNVSTGMGNLAEAAAVPALEEAVLGDPEALVRGHAAWVLGRIGGEAAAEALRQARSGEGDDFVLGEIEAALEKSD